MNAESKSPPWHWIEFDATKFSHEELLRASHRVSDQVFIQIQETGTEWRVGIRPRHSLSDVEFIAGELGNFVLDEKLRGQLRAETEPIRRLIIAQAFSKINLLRPELDTSTAAADPLGIGKPDER